MNDDSPDPSDGSAPSDAQTKDAASSDAQAKDGGSDAAVLAEIKVDQMLATIAPSTNKLSIGAGVMDAVPTCTATQFVCNGACIASGAPGAEMNGCKLIDNKFSSAGLNADGDTLYAYGERSEGLGIYRIASDGTATQLAKLKDASLLGTHQGKVIVSTTGCTGQSRFTTCLSAIPLAGGAASPVFPDLLDTTPVIAGGKAVYRGPTMDGPTQYYERALFDGTTIPRFAANTIGGLARYSSNGTYVYLTRRAGGGLNEDYLLTKLGEAGSTVLLRNDQSDAFYRVFFAGDYLYLVLRLSDTSAQYQRVKLGTTTGEALGELPFLPRYHLVAGDFLYIMPDASGTPAADHIYRMPIAGGAITPVASFKGGTAGSFAVVGNALYAVAALSPGLGIVRINLP